MQKSLFLAAILLLSPLIGLASCPDANSVTFKCVQLPDGQKHCAWSSPWWEGYQGDVEMGDHPDRFHLAFWGSAHDSNIGSVVCFYYDKHGDLVELSQNRWGGVPKPHDKNWKEGLWPIKGSLMLGKICNKNVSECDFNYG